MTVLTLIGIGLAYLWLMWLVAQVCGTNTRIERTQNPGSPSTGLNLDGLPAQPWKEQ